MEKIRVCYKEFIELACGCCTEPEYFDEYFSSIREAISFAKDRSNYFHTELYINGYRKAEYWFCKRVK